VGLRSLEGRAEREIGAPVERCLQVLRDIESWPEWLSTVRSVGVTERDDSGETQRLLVQASMLGLPLWFAAEVEFREPGELKLERVALEEGDSERLELSVGLAPSEGDRCHANAQLSADLEVPRLLPLPGAIGDQVAGRLLADLDAEASG
jgi:hypothetical protein